MRVISTVKDNVSNNHFCGYKRLIDAIPANAYIKPHSEVYPLLS
jgi:hypothetical protein